MSVALVVSNRKNSLQTVPQIAILQCFPQRYQANFQTSDFKIILISFDN